MGTVSPSQSNAGDTIEAADINTPINQLAAVINGGIDTANITDGGIGTADLANSSVTASKLATGAGAAFVATSETTASTTYADLTTVTDTVTATVGVNGLLFISFGAAISNSAANYGAVSFALSGANTLAAADNNGVMQWNGTITTELGYSVLLTGLTVGSTVVKMKYKVTAGTGTFSRRRVSAIPL